MKRIISISLGLCLAAGLFSGFASPKAVAADGSKDVVAIVAGDSEFFSFRVTFSDPNGYGSGLINYLLYPTGYTGTARMESYANNIAVFVVNMSTYNMEPGTPGDALNGLNMALADLARATGGRVLKVQGPM